MRKLATGIAAASAVALAMGAAPATAAEGNTSLAAVLAADSNRFDHNGKDFDIVTEAVLAVLAAKPDSAVGALTKDVKALDLSMRFVK